MSYILDALKQSDNQRKDSEIAGVIPHVEVNTEEVNRRTFKGWTWVGLLVLAVFIVWFLTVKDPGTAVEQMDVAAESQDLVDTSVVTPVVTPVVTVEPETSSISKEELYGVIIDVSDPSAAAEVKQDQSGKVTRQQPVEAVNPGQRPVNKPASAEKSKVAISPVSPGVSANTVNSTVENTLAVTESTQKKMETAANSGEEEIIYWRQLPLDVQRSLPDLQFSVHIFTTEPSARMVKVNGSIRHEGDLISGNVRLFKITKRGVVLIYNGHRFRMNAV
ncbi:MAG: general secretion pathway protein GspB [Amphritea sp.]